MSMQFSARQSLILLWLLIGAIGVCVCSLGYPAAHAGGTYVPLGNDSLYHARRIIDTALDPSSFYQFDPKIHAPEGSVLTWPWGYDYALGWIVRLGMEAGIAQQPIAILDWIPPAGVLLSVAMMMVLARRLSLSIWATALAGLSVAVSPLTPVLHGVGNVDHHWAEYVFVLASIGAGLKWFLRADNVRAACVLGIVLGIAPAIHNGLFILQIPVLGFMLLWWVQDLHLPRRAALFFSGALLLATLAILIPSLPFRLGLFEFYTLSWFHLYIAAGTAAATVLMSMLPRVRRNALLLGLIGVVLLLPIGHQMYIAHAFLMGTLKRLDVIAEMHSLRELVEQDGGILYVSAMYTIFIWLWPVTVGLCGYRAWRERTSGRLFFWVCSICGLVMLTLQFRMHYFGSFALFVPWLVVAEDLARKWEPRRKLVMLLASLTFVLMFSLPLRYSLPAAPASAGDSGFGPLRKILKELHNACAKEPGVVLADNDAGHLIRYFTDCSVIADNFLLTKQHMDKIELYDHLMTLHADDLPAAAPYVRYVFMRPVQVLPMPNGEGVTYVSYSQAPKTTLMSDLLLKPVADVSPKYKLLSQVVMETNNPEKPLPFMRLFELASPVSKMAQQSVPDNSRQ
jgi:hypothetical protein